MMATIKRLKYSQNQSEDISCNYVILSRLEESRFSFEFTSPPHEKQTLQEAASLSSVGQYQFLLPLPRHTVVCQRPRKQKKTRGTQVCYLLVP